jgi:hypothetical protein
MLAFASTTAPASRSRRTCVASRAGTYPASDSDPAVVWRPAVSKLSFTTTGTQWSAPIGAPARRPASSESATRRAAGSASTSALSAGPLRSYASARRR